MRMISGSLLLLVAEQSFAHAHSIPFPHNEFAYDLLLPISAGAAALGVAFLVWGLLTERPTRPVASKEAGAKVAS